MSKKTIKRKSISLIFLVIGLIMLILMLFNKIDSEYYIASNFFILVIGIGLYVKSDRSEVYE